MSRPASAQISLSNLRHNYRILCQRALTSKVMAVVKADAYGHGLDLVAPTLYAEGCREFAITDAREGKTLRDILGPDTGITVLSGIFDSEDAKLAADEHLVPAISEIRQLELLQAAGFSGGVWLKVDTGMQRLGAENVVKLFQESRHAGMDVTGVMSHLACADTPHHVANRQQVEEFRQIMQGLPGNLRASLLNSAGMASMPEHCFDIVRPGIALYGVEPAVGVRLGLRPVMRFTGRVMQVRSVPKGTSISYGATYITPRDMRIAVVSLGYADGLPRALSNHGSGIWQGRRLPIVGRICMDYCILDTADQGVQRGDEIEFWGEDLPATKVASSIDTIAYELFTRVSSRVNRQAVP